ncbi:MAG: SusC/RagA family TonB-linked outer membrane protein [Prolixibacteraceae bacterium]|jgi:TonB-linked SusC/RagA family outer membrane protein|nr:SusC/RagA family TonB-linked outer membrane protein [Prolixibacteraceae bacterium]
MRVLYTIGLFIFLLLQFFQLSAQQGFVVRGKISDGVDKQPIIGGNVIEYDEQKRIVRGTTTDVNGNFVLKTSGPDVTIFVSFIGYKSQEFKLNSQSVLNIELTPENIGLDEITVVHVVESDPLTNLSQRDMTSSRVKVDMAAIKSLGVVSAEESLQGQVAGLDIQSLSGDPGKGSSIVIRGLSSLGGAKPLIVVDGIPQDIKFDTTFDLSSADQQDIGDLVNIAPQDIKSIEVLKDAASAAVWGSKGANGVLLIETYRGRKGKTRFDYQAKFTLNIQPPAIPMLNGDEYIMMQLEQLQNANGIFEIPPEIAYDRDFVDFYNYTANTDWVGAITQKGTINDQYLSITGGGEKTRFFTSINYQKNKGTTINTSLDRLSTRINLDYNASEKLLFTTNFSYTNSLLGDNYVIRANLGEGSRNVNIREMAYVKAPNMSIMEYDPQGSLTGEYFTPIYSYQGDGTDYFNPVAVGKLSSNDIGENQINNSFVLTYRILNWLRFRETISFLYLNSKRKIFLPYNAIGADWLDTKKNEATETNSTNTKIMTRSQLIFAPKLGDDHSLSGILMWETDAQRGEFHTLRSNRGPSIDIQDPAANAPINYLGSGSSLSRSIGAMASLNYKYKDTYIASFNLRADGSSRFGASRRWGKFPSLSLGWRFSSEPWMKNYAFLSEGMLSVSYGQTGREPSSPYDRHAIYNTANPNQYITDPIIIPLQVQLANLKWQTVSSWNLKLDVSFFNNNLNVTGEVYRKITEDLLWKSYSIPGSSGYSSLKWYNGGELDNRGWELFMRAKLLQVDKMLWTFNFNISRNINSFLSFPQNFNNEVATTIGNGQYPRRANIGEPVGSFYGFRYLGVWPSDEDVVALTKEGDILRDVNGTPIPLSYLGTYKFQGGDAIYEDVNHDGVIDLLDVVYLGDSNPDFIGGFGSVFKWKNFSLSANFHYRLGYEIVNEVAMMTEGMLNKKNHSKAVLHRWRRQGQNEKGMLPRAYMDHPANNLGSDRYVEKGDYVRLSSLVLNYSMDQEFCKKIGVRSIELGVNVRRLFTITNYSGQDPEVPQTGDDPFWFGTDNARTPVPKAYTINFDIGF